MGDVDFAKGVAEGDEEEGENEGADFGDSDDDGGGESGDEASVYVSFGHTCKKCGFWSIFYLNCDFPCLFVPFFIPPAP